MDRKEYNERLDIIEQRIDKSGTVEGNIINELEKLKDYKPVSTRWYQLMCKILIKNGEVKKAIDNYEQIVSRECIYDANTKLWKQLIEALKIMGQDLKADREQYIFNILHNKNDNNNIMKELEKVRIQFVEGDESLANIVRLAELYYITFNQTLAYILYKYAMKKYPVDTKEEILEVYADTENISYLNERIEDKTPVIIISEDYAQQDYDIMTYILSSFGTQVYFISDLVKVEGQYRLEESVAVSMDNAQEFDDCIAIPAVSKYYDGKDQGNNIPYIIDYICKKKTNNDFAMVISSNNMIERLRIHPYIAKRFERLSAWESSSVQDTIGFARAGDYYAYVGYLYGMDVKSCVDSPADCDFSIVIPVRNAGTTLEYTLRTCLEQEYEGSYEIILSDNSVNEYTGVYDVYAKINNPHIRYVKTPRNLNLTKSFEYAFLQTRGRFIIALGADDGLFPWTLKILNLTWRKWDKANILTWGREFYAWPGFNGGQQNELMLTKPYKKDEISCRVDSGEAYLNTVINEPATMYVLPNMYINTAFRREYMKILYEKTGVLWDGYSQDIYMGLINAAINNEIVSISYPLSVAGLSSSSVGSVCTLRSISGNKENQELYKRAAGGKNIYSIVHTREYKRYPDVATDVGDFYKSVAKLVAKGIISHDYISGQEKSKEIFIKCFESLSLNSDKFEKLLYEGRVLSQYWGSSFVDWYNNTIFKKGQELRHIPQEIINHTEVEKTYQEGYTEYGGLILDASRYNVLNIYDAVQLIKEFIHF